MPDLMERLVAALGGDPKDIVVRVSVSRCLYCGRRTAHEVCRHETSRCHGDVDAGWTNRDLPPEECPPGCDQNE